MMLIIGKARAALPSVISETSSMFSGVLGKARFQPRSHQLLNILAKPV